MRRTGHYFEHRPLISSRLGGAIIQQNSVRITFVYNFKIRLTNPLTTETIYPTHIWYNPRK